LKNRAGEKGGGFLVEMFRVEMLKREGLRAGVLVSGRFMVRGVFYSSFLKQKMLFLW
jgi:hypothetical protein